jgi:hypothetical protein
VNEAVVNEDPNEKMIRELREEVERLRQLAAGTAVPAAQLEKLTAAARKEVEEKAELEMQRYKEELEQSQKLIESMSKTWEEKVCISAISLFTAPSCSEIDIAFFRSVRQAKWKTRGIKSCVRWALHHHRMISPSHSWSTSMKIL